MADSYGIELSKKIDHVHKQFAEVNGPRTSWVTAPSASA
jgi:hypothetical protein